jgi:hypothetical protein
MRVPTAKIPIPSMISLNSSNSLMKILNSCRNLSPSQMTHIFIIFLPFFRFFFALIARHRFAMFIYCVILIWYIFSKKSSNFFVNLMRWLNQIQSTIIIFILYLFSTHFNLVVLKIVWGDLNEIRSEFFLLFFHMFIQFLFFHSLRQLVSLIRRSKMPVENDKKIPGICPPPKPILRSVSLW